MVANFGGILDYLRDRKYGIGVVGIDSRGELGAPINGVFLTEQKIRWLAEFESCKDANTIVDGLGLADMAKACRTVSEHPSVDSRTADEARDLEHRVMALQNPPDDKIPTETEIEQIPFQAKVLCTRMAYLLTREFPYLWN
jgi:hypothetical protein